MLCRQCEYRLWNLTTRQCPECGTPFRPSDYEFVPNSVQFCCPHCQQPYFGTGEKGHLVPPAFNCVRCARPVSMDEMVLLPTHGVEEEQTRTEQMPWLERKKRGTVRAWFSTVGAALIRPGRLIQSVPMDSSAAAAWWFAILTNVVPLTICLSPFFLLAFGFNFMATRSGGGGGGGGGAAAGIGWLVLVFGVGLLLSTASTIMLVLVWTLAAHALLRLTGHTAGGLRRTFHAIGYSAGANVLSAVPCFGYYFGWIWWLISAVLMVRDGQRVHGGRATFAVITLPTLVIAGIVGLYVWILTSLVPGSLATARSQATAAVGKANTLTLVAAVNVASARDGRLPDHALQLAVSGALAPTAFVAPGSETSSNDVPIGDITLNDFIGLDKYEAQQAADKAARNLPAGTCAHRLGDFVFTWHGIDLPNADPKLWLLVLWPDPDVNGPLSTDSRVAAGLADGTVNDWPIEQFPAALKAQNELRARFGLPPLPDPATVTHGRPAVGG